MNALNVANARIDPTGRNGQIVVIVVIATPGTLIVRAGIASAATTACRVGTRRNAARVA
jgi:hypothetical protein